jgi:hypothetical protein
MTAMSRLPVLTAGFLLVAAVAWSADDATQGVEVDNLSFKAPAAWKKVAPSNAMRKAQFRIEPAKGDDTPGELSISSFGGGGGGVKANIDRWRGQFKDKSGSATEAEIKTTKGDNYEVTRVELSGTYTDPFSKAGPQANYRLLGAIVSNDNSAFFIKLIGPDKTVLAAETGFDDLLKTIKVGKP